MTDMKCPFCNGELVGTIGHPICRNQNCVMCDDPMPQDLLEELIRTRKALDFALAELQEIDGVCDDNKYTDNLYVGLDGQDTRNIALDVKKTITQIKTALEQKQPTFVHNKIEFPEFNDNLLEEFDKQFFEDGQDDDLTEPAPEQKD